MSRQQRGVVLTSEALELVNRALEAKAKGTQLKRVTLEQKSEWMGGINVKTAASILKRKAVDDTKLILVFQCLNLPPFSRERHCVSQTRVASVKGNLEERLPSSVIQRKSEVSAIRELLKAEDIVTLTGPGGVGKTWLALRVGKAMEGVFTDGVWFVALDSLPPQAEEGEMVRKIAATLNLSEVGTRPLIETVLDFLKEKKLLLILDNCEHLGETCALLARRLVAQSSALRVLATSRELLNIDFERCYEIPALAIPDKRIFEETGDIAMRLLQYDGVRLFVECARRPGFELTLTPENAAQIVSFCQYLGGIPLAIELVAARVRKLSLEYDYPLEELEKNLAAHFLLWTEVRWFTPPRQRSLEAAIDWSYHLLNPQEQALLQHLSLFAGGGTRAAVQVVCAFCADVESSGLAVMDCMASLMDKNLVMRREQGGKIRYHLLETIREYAGRRLEESGGSDAVRRRHRDYFLTLAEQAEPELRGAKQAEWMRYLTAEQENFRVALEWSLSKREVQASLRLCGALVPFWRIRGFLSGGRELCARALVDSRERTAERAKVLNEMGRLAYFQSDYPAARNAHEEALSIWKELGNQRGIARSLNSLGHVAGNQSDYVFARSCHEKSLAQWQEVGDQHSIALVLNSLGNIATHQGDYPLALSCHNKSYALSKESGNQSEMARALNNLGFIAQNHGDHILACSYYEETLVIWRELGDRHSTANTLKNLAFSSHSQADYVSAQAYLEESIAICRETGERSGIASAFNGLGRIACVQGNYETARSYFEESLTIGREIGDRNGVTYVLGCLGDMASAQGDNALVLACWRECLVIFQEIGKPWGIVCALEALANLATRVSETERAAVLWGASEALREEIGLPVPSHKQAQYDNDIDIGRQALGGKAFAAAWAEGKRMTLDEAVAYALQKIVPLT